MFKDSYAFSGFSVDDIEAAKDFYGTSLGLTIDDIPGMEEFGMAQLHLSGGATVMLYEKADHRPAGYTVLNFPVPDIDVSVAALEKAGIGLIKYDDPAMRQDDRGVARGLEAGMGPDIAWFTDPAGNILSVMQSE